MIRKILLGLALALSSAAFAQVNPPLANDVQINVANGNGTFQSRYIDTLKTGALGMMVWGQDPTPGAPAGQLRPQMRTIGTGIVCGSTANSNCDVVGSSMTIYSSQISDSTATGRAVLTAADQTAARLAIGAGTSSFDGSYASLTAVPSTFAPAAHTQPWSTITSTPTTRAGYGITDAQGTLTLTTTGTGAASLINNTLNIPFVSAPPVINRAVITTATDGTYSWTLPTACTGTPVVSVTPQNSTASEVINHKITAVSSTSVSIAMSRAVLTLNGVLGLTIPVIQTTPGAQSVHLIAVCP